MSRIGLKIISNVLPPSTNSATFSTLEDIINNQRGGLLSIGFILALYFSTNGMSSLIQAFNSSYHIMHENWGEGGRKITGLGKDIYDKRCSQ